MKITPCGLTKLSRTKLELAIDCPFCFWMDMKLNVSRVKGPPFTLNNAVDWLLKAEFDKYREKKLTHPVMVAHRIVAAPWNDARLRLWRHTFTGIQTQYEGFLVYGAVDDIWIDAIMDLHVVDYKATGAKETQIYDSYRRQMEIYQWLLLQQEKVKVSPVGYFLYAQADKTDGFDADVKARLPFTMSIKVLNGDVAWVGPAIKEAARILKSDTPPVPRKNCGYCGFVRASYEMLLQAEKRPQASTQNSRDFHK